MKKSIVYSSLTGNTKMLAETILKTLNEDIYCGALTDDALKSDLIFVGFWTTGFSCDKNVKEFLQKLDNKKIFLFGTAGYNNTEEFFNNILNSVKESINSTNEIVGEFMCQGKVSEAKQEAIKSADIEKYNTMKPMLDESVSHPNTDDLSKLVEKINSI